MWDGPDDKTILDYAKEHQQVAVYCVHHMCGPIAAPYSGWYDGYFYEDEYSCCGSYDDIINHHKMYDLYDDIPDSVRVNEEGILEMVFVIEQGELEQTLKELISAMDWDGPEDYELTIELEYNKRYFPHHQTDIVTRVVGVSFDDEETGENRQSIISGMIKSGLLKPDCTLELRREPCNSYDNCAIAVIGPDSRKLGYVSRELAADLAPMIDNGEKINARVSQLRGNGDEFMFGIEMRLTVEDPSADWWMSIVKKQSSCDR